MKKSDQVRQYVRASYIEPAVRKGETLVRIRVGDVHEALHWNNRVPSVCQAISADSFLEENNLELVDKHGPPSGLSTTTVFTFRLKSRVGPAQAKSSAFDAIQGIGREAFKKLGGGETFLRRERSNFYVPGKDPNDRDGSRD